MHMQGVFRVWDTIPMLRMCPARHGIEVLMILFTPAWSRAQSTESHQSRTGMHLVCTL